MVLAASAYTADVAKAADGDWTLAKSDQEGERAWKLYRRKVEGSEHLRYRIESAVDAPPEAVLRAALRKIDEDTFLPGNQRRRVLRRSKSEQVNYLYLDVPFVADRDVVVQTNWSIDPKSGGYRMDWRPANGGPPAREGVVRIRSQGFWEFVPDGPGRTRVVYEQHSELGDSIPQWLVDRMMDDEILRELRTLFAILDQGEVLPAVAAPPSSRAAARSGLPRVGLEAASALTD